ncbi:unnamed protein product [marine sediment metagenome]|uniref:Uncharacterized protein n=1 Tax=marine sediment metagenome TaxID=412755 RepID=X1S4T1_9ZZZZ
MNKNENKFKTKTRSKIIIVYFLLLVIIVAIFSGISIYNLSLLFTLSNLVYLIIFIGFSIFAGYIGCRAYRNIRKIEGKEVRVKKEKYNSLMAKKKFTKDEKKILLDFYKPIDEKRVFKDANKMVHDKDPWDKLKNDLFKSMSNSEGDEN